MAAIAPTALPSDGCLRSRAVDLPPFQNGRCRRAPCPAVLVSAPRPDRFEGPAQGVRSGDRCECEQPANREVFAEADVQPEQRKDKDLRQQGHTEASRDVGDRLDQRHPPRLLRRWLRRRDLNPRLGGMNPAWNLSSHSAAKDHQAAFANRSPITSVKVVEILVWFEVAMGHAACGVSARRLCRPG